MPISRNLFGDHRSLHSLSQIPPKSADARRAWKSGLTAFSETFHFWGRMCSDSCWWFASLTRVELPVRCRKLRRSGAALWLSPALCCLFLSTKICLFVAKAVESLWFQTDLAPVAQPGSSRAVTQLPLQKSRSRSPAGGSELGSNQPEILYKFLRVLGCVFWFLPATSPVNQVAAFLR